MKIFYARRKVYMIFFMIGLIPTLVAALGYAIRGAPIFRDVALIVGIYFIGVFVWLRSFRLELKDNMLKYKSLVNGTQTLAYRDIRQARMILGRNETIMESFRPAFRIEVYPVNEHLTGAIIVSINIFESRCVEELKTFLGEKLVGVE
jgi:hypothetical protein